MKRLMILILAAPLAACGADGEPIQPQANLAVGVGSSGTHVGANLGLSKGPFSIFVGV